MNEGLLLIDKPKGMTSHDVIYRLRKILNIKQIGHCGTLDPFATGVLMVLVGKATKLSKYYIEKDKSYLATMIMGRTTDTLDSTGIIIENMPVSSVEEREVNSVLQSMVGHILQTPPAYSAIKIDGHKLYELARKNKLPEVIPPREVDIYEMSTVSLWEKTEEYIRFRFSCSVSKGTYIRTLASDIAQKMKNVGMLEDLRRTKSGIYSVDECDTLEDIEQGNAHFHDALRALELPVFHLNEEQTTYVSNGRHLDASLFDEKTDTLLLDFSGKPLAIYQYDLEHQLMRMSVYLR